MSTDAPLAEVKEFLGVGFFPMPTNEQVYSLLAHTKEAREKAEECQATMIKSMTDIFASMGFKVRYGSLGEITLIRTSPEEIAIREELNSLGWELFTEQRAFLYEAFAYRRFYGGRIITPHSTADLMNNSADAAKAKLTILQNLLTVAKESDAQSDQDNYFGVGQPPQRVIDQEVMLLLPNRRGRPLAALIMDVIKDVPGKDRLHLKVSPKDEEPFEIDVWAWQTFTKEEINKNDKNTITPGEVAYTAYAEKRDWKNFDGISLPKFAILAADPEKKVIAEAWEAAGNAVIRYPASLF